MKIHNLNLSMLKLIVSLSGYMHDFGKANELFQSKIRGTDQLSDIVRHEFLSFHIVLKLIEMYEKEILTDIDVDFINRNKWNQIFNTFDVNEEFVFYKKRIQSILDIKNDNYNFKITDNSNPIILCILLAILTHHKLPSSIKENKRLNGILDFPLEYNNTNNIYNIEKEEFKKLKKNLSLHSNYYINSELEKKINIGFKKIYTEYKTIKQYVLDNKKTFFKSFSIISRILLVMSDHHVSSIQKRNLLINKKNKNDYSKTYANTNRDFNNSKISPTFNQTLDEHLLEVGDTSIKFLEELSIMMNSLPYLSKETIKNIMSPSNKEDFKWQDKAVEFIKGENNQTTLILNMGTTGSGKTRMNVKALGALNEEKLRFTSVFNLKSLTLQTGDAYNNQLKLKNNELSVLIGDKNYLDIQSLDNNLEELKLDNDMQAIEQEYLIEGEFKSEKDWKERPSFIKNKTKNGYKIDDFIGVPVLTSTIDFCINAGDLSKGSNHNNAFLRIMSSDLIIDEIDTYDPEMLESVLRLITISAMNKRNIVISSATLSKNYIHMIKKAFEYGIELGNIFYGDNEKRKIICISNLIEPKCIEKDEDITEYINNLSLKFCDNKQKKAAILPIDLNKKIEPESIPAVFYKIQELHINNHQKFNDKSFSFGLIRVGKIKHAVQFAKKYLNTDFGNQKYSINNEKVEVRFLIYHSNLINSKRFILEDFLDKTLNQNSKSISNPFVLDIVEKSKAKHVIFIVIATPVEEIGRDHDFHWAIIEPSSIQSIVQTAGRVNRHRKENVNKPNIYVIQYNLSYYQKKGWEDIYFTKPGLERNDNKYKQDMNELLPWSENHLYITSELRYISEFAKLDDKSISLSLNDLNFKFKEKDNYWFRLEYYLLNPLRKKESETFTYIIDSHENKFYQQINDKKGNAEYIDFHENIYNNALILPTYEYEKKIKKYPYLQEWSNQCEVNIYNDKDKQNLHYHHIFGFYFST